MLQLNCIFQAEDSLRKEVEPAGIIVESRTFKTNEDPINAIQDLFVSE